MTCTSTSAPIAHAFDPSAWLTEFESVGGGYALTDSRFSLMWQIDGRSMADQHRASQLMRELTADDRDALIVFLSGRRVGEG